MDTYYSFLKEYIQNNIKKMKNSLFQSFLTQEKKLKNIHQNQVNSPEENEEGQSKPTFQDTNSNSLQQIEIFKSGFHFVLPFFATIYSGLNPDEKISFNKFILFLLEYNILLHSSLTKPLFDILVLMSLNTPAVKKTVISIPGKQISSDLQMNFSDIPHGLHNLGMICYAISVIQLLSRFPEFSWKFLSMDFENNQEAF
jgi:hypothetical protein